jgi:hypothetical protein
MPIKNVDYIVTAKHYGGSARGYIRKMQREIHKRGVAVTIKNLDDEPIGIPIVARIWQGQWIADCECNGACFVDPDEPVFFCFTCGNRANGQKPRPVIFPPEEERKEIERLLLERPVSDLAGLTELERAGMAKPVLFVQVEEVQQSAIPQGDGRSDQLLEDLPKTTRTLPLTRSWEPGETSDDLHKQQDEPIKEWRKTLRQDALKGKAHVIQ